MLQLSLDELQVPSGHNIGAILVQVGIDTQSYGFYLHVLSKHLYGASTEHVTGVPQTPVDEQLPSGHLYFPTEH